MNYFLTSTTKLLALYVLTTLPALAQPGSGGPGPGAPTADPTADPTAVPLDGGASLLLVGGVGYGLKRLRDRRASRVKE
jgi:hypothetical protein